MQYQAIPCGTQYYYPPEMFELFPAPNLKVDIFSLAITLYYYFFDFLPYNEYFDKNSTINKTFHFPLKKVLDKGASLDANDRYKNVGEFREAIKKALDISR